MRKKFRLILLLIISSILFTGCGIIRGNKITFKEATSEQKEMLSYILQIEKESIDKSQQFSTEDFIAVIYHNPKAMEYIENEASQIEKAHESYKNYLEKDYMSLANAHPENNFHKRMVELIIINRILGVLAVQKWNSEIDSNVVYATSRYSLEKKSAGIYFYKSLNPYEKEVYSVESSKPLMRFESSIVFKDEKQMLDLTYNLGSDGQPVEHPDEFPRWGTNVFAIYNHIDRKSEKTMPLDIKQWE